MLLTLLNHSWKWISGTGILLILYGYASRFFSIFFFWESRFIGWIVVLSGLALFFAALMKKKKMKKVIPETIAFCICLLLVIFQLAVLVIYSNTIAFRQTKELVANHPDIINQTGKLNDISLTPVGQVELTNAEDYGSATFNLILKGEKKYIDLEVQVSKETASEWKIIKYR